ncbi:hypothetical protein SEA_APHELION_153 [Gordonia phage Aphelion]|uniref:Uncharacterized protein n=1 Tax=Gordonia phage Aphelion TaxID=2507860 RepID=A0A410TDA9_9CAUD|nr:hypothetical protein SEA_APHELION_153 [Gordonia phage Aphelion]
MISIRFWLTHPREAMCDLGLWGCDLHIRSGWFTPAWKRLPGKKERMEME